MSEILNDEILKLIEKNKAQYFIPENKVPLSSPTFGVEEIAAATLTLASSFVTSGKKVVQFESQFAEYIGRKHAIMVNSGSSANFLMISALCSWQTKILLPGDEVIVPAVTWPTTIYPIIQLGLRPIFVDCGKNTLNIDTKKVKAAISDKTKAIVAVPILGNPCSMKEIESICSEYSLVLLEDTCESLGSEYNSKKCGSFGLMSSFSFFFSHHITCIEGGIITTDDDWLADVLRCQRAHGWTRDMNRKDEINAQYSHIDPRFLFHDLGFNFRSTDVNASIAIIQLKKLDYLNKHRINLANSLTEKLKKYSDFFEFTEVENKAESTWFGFPFLVKEGAPFNRGEFMRHLEAAGIETRPIVGGNLARQPAFDHVDWEQRGGLENADMVHSNGIYFGIHPGMNDRHIDYIDKVFNHFIRSI